MYNRDFRFILPIVLLCLFQTGSTAELRPVSTIRPPTSLIRTRIPTNLGKITNQSLSQISVICEVQNRMYGAASEKVFHLDHTGAVTRTIPIKVQKIGGIAPFTGASMLIGDAGGNSLRMLDVNTGQLTHLLSLSQVNTAGFQAGDVMKTGQLSGVAFDGVNFYVAYNAGFSSSIFKLDAKTGKLLAHGWSAGPDTSALASTSNGIVALSRDGKELRPFTSDLKQTYDVIRVPVNKGSSIILRDTEIKVMSPVDRSIVTLKLDSAIVMQPTADRLRVRVPDRIIINPGLLVSKKYAFLVCGALASSGFYYDPAWNDTLWMYKMLLAAGFAKQNIYVLYGNGYDFISANPNYRYPEQVTDFPATKYWVDKVLDGMKNGDAAYGITKLTSNDKLFIWTFGHGAGGNPVSLCLYDQWYNAASLSAKFNAIPCAKRAIFMQQCHSGGFIPYLRRADTFISTACTAAGVAYTSTSPSKIEYYGGTEFHHCAYNFNIISAFSGKDVFNAVVSADSGDAGTTVSALESHTWRVNHPDPTCAETPQMDNMGGAGQNYVLN